MNVNGVRHEGRLALIQEFDAKFAEWLKTHSVENNLTVRKFIAEVEEKKGLPGVQEFLRFLARRLDERHRDTTGATERRQARDERVPVQQPTASHP